jgi:hypothetical protein
MRKAHKAVVYYTRPMLTTPLEPHQISLNFAPCFSLPSPSLLAPHSSLLYPLGPLHWRPRNY